MLPKKAKKKKKKKKKKKMWGYPCFLKSYRFSKIRKIDFLKYFLFHFLRNRSKICQRNVF